MSSPSVLGQSTGTYLTWSQEYFSPTPSSSSPRLIFLKWKSRWVNCVKNLQFPTSLWKKSTFLGLWTQMIHALALSLLSASPAGSPPPRSCFPHHSTRGPCFMTQCLCLCRPFSRMLFPWLASSVSLQAPWKHFLPVRLELLESTASAIPSIQQGPTLRWIQVQNQELLSAASGCKTPQEISVGVILSSPPGLH